MKAEKILWAGNMRQGIQPTILNTAEIQIVVIHSDYENNNDSGFMSYL